MSCNNLIKRLCLAQPEERSSSDDGENEGEDEDDKDKDVIKVLLDQLFDIKYVNNNNHAMANFSCPQLDMIIPQLPINIFTWDFDPINMIISSHMLCCVFMHVIDESNLLSFFSISRENLSKFSFQVAKMYYNSSNPYHNILHAIHVFHSMHMLLKIKDVQEKVKKYPMLLFASYIAALCHDLDHCGSTNRFLVATKNKKAIQYNGIYPQEMHHAYVTLQLLEENNIIEGSKLAKSELVFKEHIVKIIMATNIAVHNTVIEQFDITNPLMCIQLCLKCADMSHTFSYLESHLKWVNMLQNEFFIQGDREKMLGLALNPLFNRDVRNILFATQSHFFSIIVIPMFELLFQTFPSTANTPIAENIKKNNRHWSRRKHLAKLEVSTPKN